MALIDEMCKMGYDVCDLYYSGSFEYVQMKSGEEFKWVPLETMDMGFVGLFRGSVKRVIDCNNMIGKHGN